MDCTVDHGVLLRRTKLENNTSHVQTKPSTSSSEVEYICKMNSLGMLTADGRVLPLNLDSKTVGRLSLEELAEWKKWAKVFAVPLKGDGHGAKALNMRKRILLARAGRQTARMRKNVAGVA